MLNVICDHTRWNPLNGRVIADSKSGCCTIGSVKKRDSGIYTLSLTGEDGKERLLRCYKYQVIDPVIIHNITRQSGNLKRVMSLTVSYSGDQPVTIIWRKDKEDLPEGCQLTHNNQTLIVPYNVSGNLTVTVSNPISMEMRNYNVSAIINPVTIHNITCQSGNLEKMISLTVLYSGDPPSVIIWRKDEEDLPEGCQLTHNNQTLIVPYNVTGKFTVTVSNPISMEERNYTIPAIIATKPSTDHNHILVYIALVGIPTSFVLMLRKCHK
ncbi:cell adhesion molecule CEACAM2-like [Lithobates pipiens]